MSLGDVPMGKEVNRMATLRYPTKPEEPEDEEWLCDCDVGDDRRSKWLDKPCSNCNPNEYERMSR